jgi:hypothetical protein
MYCTYVDGKAWVVREANKEVSIHNDPVADIIKKDLLKTIMETCAEYMISEEEYAFFRRCKSWDEFECRAQAEQETKSA